MNNFKVSTEKPIKFSVKKGERYSFCTCGHSSKMPLCDGAHKEKAPNFRSLKFEADKDQDVWLSECLDQSDKRFIKKKPKVKDSDAV